MRSNQAKGGIISTIEPGSIAEDLGLRPGDEIVSINGQELADIIDFRFYSADEFITILVRRGDEQAEFEIEKDEDTPLGVTFKDILFDGVRTCGAHCVFCFVEQLPKGLRKSLYLKDDDYRLSFLHGNFVTLGNVSEAELDRIVAQRLSPLYISVHATEHDLRERMLGRGAPDILHQIDRLAKGHISLHTQIVLCRGINDGEYLDRTVDDLASRYPTVLSIAIVPAGISIHRRHPTPIDSIDVQYSEKILDKLERWQERFRSQFDTRLIWAADEFYLSAGRRIPGAASYEGFPQIENGIGLVRKFLDSASRAKRLLPKFLPSPLEVNVVTGMLASPILEAWAQSLGVGNLTVWVCPIMNRLFGETITVTGLIAGKDVIAQLRGRELGDVIVIPSVSLREGAFLDDVTVEDVERELSRRVIVVRPLPLALIRAILDLAS